VINISSGQFLYNYNAPIAGGTLNLKLNQAATIRGTGGAAPTSYSFPLNANGKVEAINAAVWGNGELNPYGTYYTINVVVNSTAVVGPTNVIIGPNGAYVWKLFPNVTVIPILAAGSAPPPPNPEVIQSAWGWGSLSSTEPPNGQVITMPSATTAGNLLALLVVTSGDGDISITGSESFTLAQNLTATWDGIDVEGPMYLSVLYAEDITGGDTSFIVSTATENSVIFACVVEFYGALTTGALDATSVYTVNPAVTEFDVPIALSQAAELFVGIAWGQQAGLSNDLYQVQSTELDWSGDGGPQYFSVAAHYVFRGIGAFEPRWTQGSAGGGQGAIVVSFKV